MSPTMIFFSFSSFTFFSPLSGKTKRALFVKFVPITGRRKAHSQTDWPLSKGKESFVNLKPLYQGHLPPENFMSLLMRLLQPHFFTFCWWEESQVKRNPINDPDLIKASKKSPINVIVWPCPLWPWPTRSNQRGYKEVNPRSNLLILPCLDWWI